MSILTSPIFGAVPTWVPLSLVCGVLLFAVAWLLSPLFTFWWLKMTPGHASEAHYYDPASEHQHDFPSLFDQATVDCSIIVPAYNEQERIPAMLDEVITYMTARKRRQPDFKYEIIIVDDGSIDGTCRIGHEYTKRYGRDLIRVLKLHKNHGKGGAVNKGMMRARGKYLLLADADGATLFSDIERLETGMKTVQVDGCGVVVGSRAHLEAVSMAKRSFLRNILMHGFHLIVSVLCVRDIHDTQCGFKLFSRSAAQRIFPNQHIQRWAFDAELLFIANKLSIPLKEEAVNWTEIDGSKLSVVSATLQMLRDLVLIRLCYTVGVWRIDEPVSSFFNRRSIVGKKVN